MTEVVQNMQEQLQMLRQIYARQLPEQIEHIQHACTRLKSSRTDNRQTLTDLQRLAHNMAGSGGAFGYLSVSESARSLDSLLTGILDKSLIPTEEQLSQIDQHARALEQACDASRDMTLPQAHMAAHIPAFRPTDADSRLIYIVEGEELVAQHLALQIGYFGYHVKTFNRLAGLKEAVQETPPSAIIMDLGLPDGDGAETVAEIQRQQKTSIPVMFMSGRDDLTARLQAIRAGGDAFFAKPFDVATMIDSLDVLTQRQPSEPLRILIVDDDLILATHYALTLQQAGMKALVITDPMLIMPSLMEFNPELILMDVYMPGCNGIELAAVIRQQESYVGIPIVFLSAETSLDKQLSAMSLGGDDFLIKPIQAEHLIRAVSSRAQRSRVLRSFMVRDSLTGLLNHTRTKEQLDFEVARARRQNGALSFAMIDIDHFKSVNDTYGHPVGDRVIKSLSRLLQQRLRKTDVIGRYGGEEFAVILPNTDGPSAVKVFDVIREGFAQIRQRAEREEFGVTFSCGVAPFPVYANSAALSVAADKALYQAKQGGRNRMMLAPTTLQ